MALCLGDSAPHKLEIFVGRSKNYNKMLIIFEIFFLLPQSIHVVVLSGHRDKILILLRHEYFRQKHVIMINLRQLK